MTPEDVRQSELDRRFTIKDRIDVLRWIMENQMGRRWIWWLLSEAKIFSSTLGEHHAMSFDAGKRFLGLKVFALMQADEKCWALFSKARTEHNQKVEEGKNG